ncbi:9033_t:CDS:2 [Paraglomus brasilianum]|uniref:9033_t:CDS:1 n=1 Tax=Paraglomus brasilianum TaxID=144538 RepID=A0A9N9FMY4_9GLOM|nr:9033_t:CDS:2 [Paraglomus brasilianum]
MNTMFIDNNSMPQYRLRFSEANNFTHATEQMLQAIPGIWPPKYIPTQKGTDTYWSDILKSCQNYKFYYGYV